METPSFPQRNRERGPRRKGESWAGDREQGGPPILGVIAHVSELPGRGPAGQTPARCGNGKAVRRTCRLSTDINSSGG